MLGGGASGHLLAPVYHFGGVWLDLLTTWGGDFWSTFADFCCLFFALFDTSPAGLLSDFLAQRKRQWRGVDVRSAQ